MRHIQQQGDNKGLQRTNKTILARISDVGFCSIVAGSGRQEISQTCVGLVHRPLEGVLPLTFSDAPSRLNS